MTQSIIKSTITFEDLENVELTEELLELLGFNCCKNCGRWFNIDAHKDFCMECRREGE